MADRKKVTLPVLFNKVANHEPITWMTCYDYPTAYLMEQAGMDSRLTGPDRCPLASLAYPIFYDTRVGSLLIPPPFSARTHTPLFPRDSPIRLISPHSNPSEETRHYHFFS